VSRASAVRETLAAGALWSAAFAVLGAFGWILGDILLRGAADLDWAYLSEAPRRAGREGGILSVLVSTAALAAVALAVAVPLGLACAAYLAEFTRRGGGPGRWIRRSLDVLAGVPSIVFGLFGLAFFGQFLGWGWSILSGGFTLACMVLPLLVRSAEEGLRAVPAEWRRGCDALGLSKAAALRRILLPAAAPGILAGLILGLGRALAETAAVMYTAGASLRMPRSLLDPGRSLAYHVYILSVEVPGGASRAYAAALVLMLVLLATNLSAYFLVRGFQRRRLAVL
jgi:phosphate transport system permease protein